MDFSNYWWQSTDSDEPSEISRSLRFKQAHRLTRSISAVNNVSILTTSMWIKKAQPIIDNWMYIIGGLTDASSGNVRSTLHIPLTGNPSYGRADSVSYERVNSNHGENSHDCDTPPLRDTNAWYHIFFRYEGDANNGTVSLYLNGELVNTHTSAISGGYPLYPHWAGSTAATTSTIGGYMFLTNPSGYFFDGYMAEIIVCNDVDATVDDFAKFDSNGVWIPKKYTGEYGNQGYHLNFADINQLGKDVSGNNNHWTATGFVDNPNIYSFDQRLDTPLTNLPTLNQLDKLITDSTAKIVWASTDAFKESSADYGACYAPQSIPVPTKGKYLSVCMQDAGPPTVPRMASMTISDLEGEPISFNSSFWSINRGITVNIPGGTSQTFYIYNDGAYFNGSGMNTISEGAANYISGIMAYDADTGELWIGYYHKEADVLAWVKGDGTKNTDANAPINGTDPTFTLPVGPKNFGYYGFTNSGIGTSGGSAALISDQSPIMGLSDTTKLDSLLANFKYLSFDGFDPAPIRDGRDHFQAITDTGANILSAAQTEFPYGLWWIKDRANSNQHQFVDSVRGNTRAFVCPNTTPEAEYIVPTGDSVAWCWKTDGPAVANNDGVIPSMVSANQKAGFSIVTWDAAGSANWDGVGHGLTKRPNLIIYRSRNDNDPDVYEGRTFVWYINEAGTVQRGYLSDGSVVPIITPLQNATDTTISNYGWKDPQNIVAYCWHSVPGYSKIGEYKGNGLANGRFIYTGFKPAFFLFKNAGQTTGWRVVDSTRDIYNPVTKGIEPSAPNAENANDLEIDFVSNGIKIRDTWGGVNGNNQILYMAFAENPFGGPNVSPVHAR